jgi:hypothetical protein
MNPRKEKKEVGGWDEERKRGRRREAILSPKSDFVPQKVVHICFMMQVPWSQKGADCDAYLCVYYV